VNQKLLTAVLLGCTVSASVFSVPVSADTVVKYQNVTTSDMTDSAPLPPTDIYRPSGSKGPRHKDLATFAWLEFIALSAPVGSDRGTPGGSFADSGMNQDDTLVWETYQHRSELFPYTDGSTNEPQPWNNPPLYQFYVEADPQNPNVKTPYETPAEFTRYNNLDEASQIGQNTIFFPDLVNEDGELDQVLFQAKVNKVQSDYVRGRVQSASTDPIDLDEGTIEVKSAWIPLTAIPADQQYRFHISEVTVYGGEDGAPIASTEERALIGLHIIQKTPNFPTFIFATFEHTDLLNDPVSGIDTHVAYIPTYEEIDYTTASTTTLSGITGMPTVSNPNINFSTTRPVARPNGTRLRLPIGSVENLPNALDIGDDQYLVPVVQPPTTNDAVAKANRKALKAMKNLQGFDENFVWQYYKLKGVQGVPTSNEKAKDFYLANIVIESSQPGVQLFRGGFSGGTTLTNARNQANVVDVAQNSQAFSVGGCQGCHGVAQTKAGFDFSFLFGAQNGNGFTPDTSGVKSQDVMLRRLARYSLLLEPES